MLLRDIAPFVRYAQRFDYDCHGSIRCPGDARILYFVKGNGTLEIGGVAHTISPGTLALINAGCPYSIDLHVTADIIALNFDYTFSQCDAKLFIPPQKDCSRIVRTTIDDCPVLSEFLILQDMFHLQRDLEEIVNVCKTHRFYFQEEASCLLKELLIALARFSLLPQKSGEEIASNIISYLQKNYQEDITSEMIAEKFNYHAYHINRIMRNATGTTVHQYLVNYRISIAKNLLSNTSLSIEDIAVRVGYKSAAYFSLSFKKLVGCSPNCYRSAHMDNI